MFPHKLADPLSPRPAGAISAAADEIQVAGQLAAGGDVEVQAVEVGVQEGRRPGKVWG